MPAPIYTLVPWGVWLAAFVLAFGVFGFFLDRLIGYEVETLRGGTTQSVKGWSADWLWGAGVSAGILLLGLSLWVLVRTFLPFWLALASLLAVAVLVVLVLPRWQAHRCRLHAPLPHGDEILRLLRDWQLPVYAVRTYDDGGTTSLNGMFLPFAPHVAWVTGASASLTPRDLALLIRREYFFVARHLQWAVLAIVLAWLAVGLSAAWAIPAETALQRALSLSAIMTTWCFTALFVWPPLNRRWMHAADRSLLDVASLAEIASLLRHIQESNLTDTTISGAKEQIFHPIPPLERRIQKLTKKP